MKNFNVGDIIYHAESYRSNIYRIEVLSKKLIEDTELASHYQYECKPLDGYHHGGKTNNFKLDDLDWGEIFTFFSTYEEAKLYLIKNVEKKYEESCKDVKKYKELLKKLNDLDVTKYRISVLKREKLKLLEQIEQIDETIEKLNSVDKVEGN